MTRIRTLIVLLSLPILVGLALPKGARADDEGVDLLTVEVGVGTQAPIAMGGEVTLDLPLGLFARGQIGWMPAFYVDTINSMATTFDWYSDNMADLIRNTIEDSLVLRGSGGLRLPFLGIEGFIGYTAITLGGNSSASDLIGAATGRDVSRGSSRQLPMSASIHALHFGVGWRVILLDMVAFRLALGWMQPVSADVNIESSLPAAQAATDAAEAELESTMVKYLHTPIVEVAAGIRF